MFARTPRLTLRPAWAEDAPALAAAIGHAAVARNLSHVPFPYGVADAEAFIERTRDPRDLFCLILAHEGAIGTTPRLVGGIGMHPEGGALEFGYWLTPEAWGRGYATEAGRAMLSAARHTHGIRRLRAGYFIDNPASGRVLGKLGFRPTGAVIEQTSLGRGCSVACVRVEAVLADDADAELSRAA